MRALVLRLLAPAKETTEEANGVWTTTVVRQRRRRDPTLDDLAAALLDSPGEPIPPVLLDYLIKTFVLATRPQKTGRKTRTRTIAADIELIVFYQLRLLVHRDQHEADGTADTRDVTRRAVQDTAAAFDLSPRTIASIVKPRPLSRAQT